MFKCEGSLQTCFSADDRRKESCENHPRHEDAMVDTRVGARVPTRRGAPHHHFDAQNKRGDGEAGRDPSAAVRCRRDKAVRRQQSAAECVIACCDASPQSVGRNVRTSSRRNVEKIGATTSCTLRVSGERWWCCRFTAIDDSARSSRTSCSSQNVEPPA